MIHVIHYWSPIWEAATALKSSGSGQGYSVLLKDTSIRKKPDTQGSLGSSLTSKPLHTDVYNCVFCSFAFLISFDFIDWNVALVSSPLSILVLKEKTYYLLIILLICPFIITLAAPVKLSSESYSKVTLLQLAAGFILQLSAHSLWKLYAKSDKRVHQMAKHFCFERTALNSVYSFSSFCTFIHNNGFEKSFYGCVGRTTLSLLKFTKEIMVDWINLFRDSQDLQSWPVVSL